MKNFRKIICFSVSLFLVVILAGVLSACGSKEKAKHHTVFFNDMNGHVITKKVNDGDLVEFFVPDTPHVYVPDENGDLVESEEIEDWTFYRWYTDTQYSAEFDFNTPIKQSTTLYARWLTNHTLSFDVDGGTAMESINVGVIENEQSIVSLTGIQVEKEGYAFKGWYTDSEKNNPVSYPYILTGDKTLYAKWDVEGFILTFYCVNGVECKSYNITSKNHTLGMYIASNDGGLGIESITDFINKNDDKNEDGSLGQFFGYDFLGWYTDTNWEDPNTVKIDESNYDDIIIDKSMNIYGRFEAKSYDIHIYYNVENRADLDNAIIQKKYRSIINENQIRFIDDVDVETINPGKKIKGYYLDEDCTIEYDFTNMITGTFNIYIGWENITGYIGVDYAGGNVEDKTSTELNATPGTEITNIFNDIGLVDPERKGYNFVGWSYEVDGYVCTWYKNLADGYVCTNGDNSYSYNYDVGAWYAVGTGSSENVNFTYVVDVSNNKNIKAVWSGSSYTLNFKYYEQDVETDHILPGSYTYEMNVQEYEVSPVAREGFILLGFSLLENQSSITANPDKNFVFPINLGQVIDARDVDDETIVLYGIYEPAKLNITFHSNGGQFGKSTYIYKLPENAKDDESKLIRYNDTWDYAKMNRLFFNGIQNSALYLTKVDHVFVGWSTNPNATIDLCSYVHNEASEKSNITFVEDNITYYAIWTVDARNLIFNGIKDNGNGSYISSVNTIKIDIGNKINVYSKFEEMIGKTLDESTASVNDDGQYIGWYYCEGVDNHCDPTSDNVVSKDTLVDVLDELNFYPIYHPTMLEYELVLGSGKYYTVSSLYPGKTFDEYVDVIIPDYYLGIPVEKINAGVFDNCTDIESIALPVNINNDNVVNIFANSLKIVEINVNQNVLSGISTTGSSIFGTNASYIQSNIKSVNVLGLNEESLETIINSDLLNKNYYTSLSIVNGRYLSENKINNENLTLNLIIDSDATLLNIDGNREENSSTEGYPSAYKAGYDFMGWKLAEEGPNADSLSLYVYKNGESNKEILTKSYMISSTSNDYISFDGDLSVLDGKYLIAVFEKWNTNLKILDASDTTKEIFAGQKYSGEKIYSSNFETVYGLNDRFVNFFYDSKCVNPVLKDEIMPYTSDLTIYAKFVAENISITPSSLGLTYTVSSDSLDELYLSKYYKGNQVINIRIELDEVDDTVSIKDLVSPAGYQLILDQNSIVSGQFKIRFGFDNLLIDKLHLYGSHLDEVRKTDIEELNDLIRIISLYDTLKVTSDAFDSFELLEEFETICTGEEIEDEDGIVCNTKDKNLLASNKNLFRISGNSYYLVRVPINNSVADFTAATFAGTNKVINDSLIGIDDHALYKCKNITKINVPTTIKYIGELSLAYMPELVTIDGMVNVLNISNMNAFEGNYKLKSLEVSGSSGNYTSVSNVLFSKDKKILYFFPKAYEFLGERVYDVPKEVITIKAGAFDLRGNVDNSIKSIKININYNVLEIEEGAFYNIHEFSVANDTREFAAYNGNLYKYRLNDEIKVYYELVRFADASSEYMYVIPNTIETIRYTAFDNATNLTRIIYDNKVDSSAIEKQFLIGSYNGLEVNQLFDNVDSKIEIYGYNNNAYISYNSIIDIEEVFAIALERGYEQTFRNWLRESGFLKGEAADENSELETLKEKVSISLGEIFLINSVTTNLSTLYSKFDTTYMNLKMSHWLNSLGLTKGDSIEIKSVSDIHETIYTTLKEAKVCSGTISEVNNDGTITYKCVENHTHIYIGNKDTEIPLSDLDKGEVYLTFKNSSINEVSENGLVKNLQISSDEGHDLTYNKLGQMKIIFYAIDQVYYNGVKLEKDTDDLYFHTSENGIISQEPTVTYSEQIFRGWYKAHPTIPNIYETRTKFPLMIKDIDSGIEGQAPKLSAAFVSQNFESVINLKVDYQLHSFKWNGVEYYAPGYGLDSSGKVAILEKEKEKVLTKGYWMPTDSDGNSLIVSSGDTAGEHSFEYDSNNGSSLKYKLYYRRSNLIENTTNNYEEFYDNIGVQIANNRIDFFTNLNSLTLYALPEIDTTQAKQTVDVTIYDTKENHSIITHYFDIDALYGSNYYLVGSDLNYSTTKEMNFTGFKTVNHASFVAYNKTTTKTKVTIRVYCDKDLDKSYKMYIGENVVNGVKVVNETDNVAYYEFVFEDIPTLSTYNAVVGGVVRFSEGTNGVRVEQSMKSYWFDELFSSQVKAFNVVRDNDGNMTSPTEKEIAESTSTASLYYLTPNEILFTTTINN